MGASPAIADLALERAYSLLEQRMLPAARDAFDYAEAHGADFSACAGGRWMVAMLAGDFETAWRQGDALRARNTPDPHRFWNGAPLTGKRVILRCLHGFGDAVQMLRYLPQLSAMASHLTVEVPPRLVPLAASLAGTADIISWGEHAPAQPPLWEVQLEVMELPYVFRTTLRDLPTATEYISLPASETARVAHVLGPRRCPRVGIVWSAGEWNPARSLPLGMLEPLLQSPGLEFWSLQGGGANREAAWLFSTGHLRDGSLCGDGILPLAALIAALDLVITVDTLAAHLAGALGRPAWLLLTEPADWRWMVDREDSPWYPSLRLFRQQKGAGWAELLERVRAEAARLACYPDLR